MRGRSICTIALGILTSISVKAEENVAVEPPVPGKLLERLAGDAKVDALPQADGTTFYRSGDYRVTTPLPVGYPRPTPPGVVEIKQYPEVRRATFDGQGAGPDGMKNSQTAFFPLFAHIKTRGIAMTAPVEIDYKGLEGADDKPDSYDMSFLYRSKSDGKTESYGQITVADAKPVTVIAVGVSGDVTREKINASIAKLHDSIGEAGKWRAAGDPRVLGYNGPDVPQPKRWGEVQLPVEPADSDSE